MLDGIEHDVQDLLEELPRLERYIRDFQPPDIQLVLDTLRIEVTEQPSKNPHYAALLRHLHDQSTGETSLGRSILEEIWKDFQTCRPTVLARNASICALHALFPFFLGTPLAHGISMGSFTGLVRSFTVVLDEFGVSLGRVNLRWRRIHYRWLGPPSSPRVVHFRCHRRVHRVYRKRKSPHTPII